MRILVIGGGSIGARHLRNLAELGQRSLAVVEPDQARWSSLPTDARAFARLEEGWSWKPEIAVVASPTSLHVAHALEAARRGCHLLIEKPLSHSLEGVEELAEEVRKSGVVTLVGCNMRFHPGPAAVKELLVSQAIGRVLFARLHFGWYLPKYRPWQDYSKSYSARADLGGGCILDCIHEIDLARWYLGEVSEVFCLAGKLSSLKLNVEDTAMIVARHENGAVSEIHLDYVQQTYERGCQIVGEGGSIFWDFRAHKVRLFDGSKEREEVRDLPAGYDLNAMYVSELRHFLECVEASRETTLPVSDGVEVLRFALAAKDSALGRAMISVR